MIKDIGKKERNDRKLDRNKESQKKIDVKMKENV